MSIFIIASHELNGAAQLSLRGEEIKGSPDFDDLPTEPPRKKIRRRRKSRLLNNKSSRLTRLVLLVQDSNQVDITS